MAITWPDWLPNPFDWIVGQQQDMLKGLITVAEQIITNPIRIPGGTWQDYLYGNALGLAGTIFFYVIIIAVCIAMFWWRWIDNVLQLFLAFILFSLVASVFFSALDQAVAFGDSLCRAAQLIYQEGTQNAPLLTFLPAATIIGNFWSTGMILIPLVLNVGLAEYYQVITKIFGFVFLPALALRGTGVWGRRYFDLAVAWGLLAILFGRPTMIAVMEFGKLYTANLPGTGLPFVFNGIIIGSLWFAFILQILLGIAFYTGSHKVTGKIDARVKGEVTAARKKLFAQTRSTPQSIQNRSYASTPEATKPKPTVRRSATRHTINVGANVAAAATQKAAFSGNPQAIAAHIIARVVRDLSR